MPDPFLKITVPGIDSSLVFRVETEGSSSVEVVLQNAAGSFTAQFDHIQTADLEAAIPSIERAAKIAGEAANPL